jgi:phosphatidylglycerol:prolipoprotein diacylglycerol transferase
MHPILYEIPRQGLRAVGVLAVVAVLFSTLKAWSRARGAMSDGSQVFSIWSLAFAAFGVWLIARPPERFLVRSFGVALACAFLLGSWIYGRLIARTSDDPERDVARYGVAPMWVLIGAVAGARLMYVAVEIAKGTETRAPFLENPLEVLAVWEGGLAMYGGLFGAILAGAWAVKREGLRFGHAADVGLTAGFFGQALGRVGCLLVGDDYGARVPESLLSTKWAWMPIRLPNGGEIGPLTVRVPDPLPAHSLFGDENAGAVLWATQPMMSAKAMIVALACLWLLRRRKYEGQVAIVAVLLYSLLRFAVEALRGDEVRGVWLGGALSTSQMIAALAAVVCAVLLVRNARAPARA